ncbi:unnamed protein product [Rotaria socialis]|uniref:Reverse transcriptase domain-containing protein n=1 Tax=Rotaria socialis TaxID=392032 RepID=A0A818PFU6_9BILA|nr:unnamed protein product [Rotaria socialis]
MPITKHNYLKILRQQYGPYITNNVFYYGKTLFKISKIKCDLSFLKSCKREKVLPTFVQFKVPSTHLSHQRAIQNCFREILINEIKVKKRQLTECYRIYNNLKSLLDSDLHKKISDEISIIINEIDKGKVTSVTERHITKLNKLRELKNFSEDIKHSSTTISPIKNYSKRVLTRDETLALENGLDFIFPSLKFDDETFIANIETLFVNLLGYCSEKTDYDELDLDERISYNLTPEQLCLATKLRKSCDTFRQHARKSISRYKKEIDPIVKTLKNLSKDKTIYITRPDKVRAVVILERSDYLTKMELILNEPKTFKQLDEDPTIQKEDKLQRKLLHLKNIGFLTDSEYKFTRPVGSQPGKAYGLPKIHKDGVPLRPIISACGTFNYKLSKLLANKLKHLRTSPTIVIDTFKFVKELQNLKLNTTNIKMVSFDIVSLFTRVPLARTIDLILDKMYGPIHTCSFSELKRTDWCSKCQHRYELKWLLDISTKDSHFIFNEKLYCQTEGVAMGSPLGPLFADIYINYLESKLKRRLDENGVLYWKRFVDDCFVLVNDNADINKLLGILNSFDVDIQFTVETEKNNSISFLDILITRTNFNVNETDLNTLPIELLHSFLRITKERLSIVSVEKYEQLLNLLRLQYPRNKLNNQKSSLLLPFLYPSPIALVSSSCILLTSIQKTDETSTNYQKHPNVDEHIILSEHATIVVQLLHRYLLAYRDSQPIDQINFGMTQLNYLQQEISSLIYKPNFTEVICYAFDNVISETSLEISPDYFTSLRKILKLNRVQEILLVFALHDSIHVKFQALARGHLLNCLREFFQTISNTYESNLFSTSIYRKPTFTGLLLKWNSYVPHSYKVSAISSMIYRAIKICSSYSSMHIEFEYIQNLALKKKNDYPLKFVQNQIKKTLNRHFEGLNKISNETLTKPDELDNKEMKKEQVFIDLPFIGIETKMLGKKIIDLAKYIRPDLHIQPIPRPPPAITTFFPQKDKINKNAQSNIVYSISCSDCDVGYI